MTDRLRECPFCGGGHVDVWKCRVFANIFRYSVNCYDCHFGLGFEETKEQAIEQWNTRKPMDRIVEQLESQCSKTVSMGRMNGKILTAGFYLGILNAIEIVKEGGGE